MAGAGWNRLEEEKKRVSEAATDLESALDLGGEESSGASGSSGAEWSGAEEWIPLEQRRARIEDVETK